MLTDEEIADIADMYVEQLCHCGVFGIFDNKVESFARAIEAKVRAEHEPKFKVGDRVKFVCRLGKETGIIDMVYPADCNHYGINVGTSAFPVDVYVAENELELAKEK